MPRPPASDPPSGPGTAGPRAGGGVRAWVEHIMGTAVSIAVCTEDAGPPGPPPLADQAVEEAVQEAFATLRRADALFSPFRSDSQISRLRDGRTSLERCDPDVRGVLMLCEDLRRSTGGCFDVCAAGPDLLDPCGVVKGWAAERASDLLCAAGAWSHYVNAGGDVRLRGRPARERLWRVGPAQRGERLLDRFLDRLVGQGRGTRWPGVLGAYGDADRGAHDVLDPRPHTTARPRTGGPGPGGRVTRGRSRHWPCPGRPGASAGTRGWCTWRR